MRPRRRCSIPAGDGPRPASFGCDLEWAPGAGQNHAAELTVSRAW
jgi:hypothetical protein